VEHNKGIQYDDDLTVGLDDLGNESIDTGYVDLFEYGGDEESPLSRLKTLMLSIEWEITDEVLIDFNNELVQTQKDWADDKVKLVYIQALQIVSKYIYQKKADSHPNAMKVLLSFYYNLEKIVLDTELSEQEKTGVLLGDVKIFERFKQQIGLIGGAVTETRIPAEEAPSVEPDLYNLKAAILGIDWEITDEGLSNVSQELKKLQTTYVSSKPRMLLLQGIDAIGGYIKLKKSDAHPDSFRLLNSFYENLEKIVTANLSSQEQKSLLLAEAAKFEKFKSEVASSITPEALVEKAEQVQSELPSAPIPEEPLADVPQSLSEEDPESFSEEALEKITSFFGEVDDDLETSLAALSAEEALRGVDVETEADDDSDETDLPILTDGKIAPALADLEPDGFDPAEAPAVMGSPLQGVDVESEADDDSEEAPLPVTDGEIAPALFDSNEQEALQAIASSDTADGDPTDIGQHVDDFFSDLDAALDQQLDDTEGVIPEITPENDVSVAPALAAYNDEPEAAAFSDIETVVIEEDTADSPFGLEVDERIDSFFEEDSEDPFADTEVTAISDERFDSLKSNIDSFAVEISDSNIVAVQTELDNLRDAFTDRPIENTLLHLVTAVVSFIAQHQNDSSDEEVGLLQSAFNSLEQVRSSAVDQNQALILLSAETAKIIQWQQQKLLNR